MLVVEVHQQYRGISILEPYPLILTYFSARARRTQSEHLKFFPEDRVNCRNTLFSRSVALICEIEPEWSGAGHQNQLQQPRQEDDFLQPK